MSPDCVAGRITLEWSYAGGTFSGTKLPANPNYTSPIDGYSNWTWTPYALQPWGETITATSTYATNIPSTVNLEMRGLAGTYPSGVNLSWFSGTQFGNPVTSAMKGCWTFSFSKPLCNLKFAITDIDYGVREWIYFDPSGSMPTRYSIVDPTAVGGTGVVGTPWHSLIALKDWNNGTDANGNVKVEFDGAVSSFTICGDSRTASASKFEENVALSDFSFDCHASQSCA